MTQPYINWYTSDFLAGTSGMTAATKGVYVTLLCLMYEAEEPLNQSWEALARRCGCTLPAFKKAVHALEEDAKIEKSERGLWSSKCDRHITLRRERQSSARSAAKKRWKKSEEKQRAADAVAVRAQCQPEPEPEPDIPTPTVPLNGETRARDQPPDGGGEDLEFRERLLLAMGLPREGILPSGRVRCGRDEMQIPESWLARGLSEDQILAVIGRVMVGKQDGPPSSLKYFERPMSDEIDRQFATRTELDRKVQGWKRMAKRANAGTGK